MGLLQPLPVPSRQWSHIAVDFVTRLPPSHGHTVVLTIVDRLSKMVHCVPLTKFQSATETADLLALHVFRLHRLPSDIVSDRGPQFTSRVWQAFCKIFNITCSLTSGYHPQSNGQTERANQDLETALRCVSVRNPSSWSSFLTWVEYSHNSLSSAATGMTPFMAAYGYQPPLLSSQERDITVPSVQVHFARCAEVWRTAREAITHSTRHSQRQADRHHIPAPTYLPGQRVWLSSRDLPLQVESRKVAPRFVGPFVVEKVVNPSAVRLKLPASLPMHPTFHVSQLKPVSSSELNESQDLELLAMYSVFKNIVWI